MTDLNTIGNSSRKTNFDPDLAARVNERFAKEEKSSGTVSGRETEMENSLLHYSQVEWNLKAGRVNSPPTWERKWRRTFPSALDSLRQAGYERHPSHREVFSLLIDYFEDRLTDDWKLLVEDLLWDSGEWLDLCVYRNDDKLEFYELLEGITDVAISDPQEGFSKMKCGAEKSFQIMSDDFRPGDIPLSDVARINPDLVKYLWSAPFEQLPREIKRKATLYIPPLVPNRFVLLGFDSSCSIIGENYSLGYRGVKSVTIKQ